MPETDRDASADTARFQAFAARQEGDRALRGSRAAGPRAGVLVMAVVAVAVLVVIAAAFLIG